MCVDDAASKSAQATRTATLFTGDKNVTNGGQTSDAFHGLTGLTCDGSDLVLCTVDCGLRAIVFLHVFR